MRKVSRMIRIGVLAAALAAMTLTVSACGKKKQQPEVTEVTEPTAAVEETTVEESTEAITIESEESTAETRPGSDPELTDILNDINNVNCCASFFSFQRSICVSFQFSNLLFTDLVLLSCLNKLSHALAANDTSEKCIQDTRTSVTSRRCRNCARCA